MNTHEFAETIGRDPDAADNKDPTHFLSAYTPGNNEAPKGRIGRAWLNQNGSISIKLNHLVVIPAGTGLTLWPANERDRERSRK